MIQEPKDVGNKAKLCILLFYFKFKIKKLCRSNQARSSDVKSLENPRCKGQLKQGNTGCVFLSCLGERVGNPVDFTRDGGIFSLAFLI